MGKATLKGCMHVFLFKIQIQVDTFERLQKYPECIFEKITFKEQAIKHPCHNFLLCSNYHTKLLLSVVLKHLVHAHQSIYQLNGSEAVEGTTFTR
jgi:hypothetical protein